MVDRDSAHGVQPMSLKLNRQEAAIATQRFQQSWGLKVERWALLTVSMKGSQVDIWEEGVARAWLGVARASTLQIKLECVDNM